jgi:hypothetical protein
MKLNQKTESYAPNIESVGGEERAQNTNTELIAPEVPNIAMHESKWAWTDWFQLIMIFALFVILLFPLWFFLYEILFLRH